MRHNNTWVYRELFEHIRRNSFDLRGIVELNLEGFQTFRQDQKPEPFASVDIPSWYRRKCDGLEKHLKRAINALRELELVADQALVNIEECRSFEFTVDAEQETSRYWLFNANGDPEEVSEEDFDRSTASEGAEAR